MADQLQSIVQRMIDAGEPEENIGAVIQHYKSQTQAPPTPHALVRSPRTGQLYDQEAANAPGPLEHFGQRLVSNLNPVNIAQGLRHLATSLVTDPKAAGEQVIEGIAQPFRAIGRGEFPEAAADFGTAALFARFPGPKGAAPAEMFGGIPVSELKAAGVGKGTLDIMQRGRPPVTPMATRPSPGVLETRGTLALKPQAEAPLATPNALQMPPPRGLSAGEEAGVQSLDQLMEALHGGDQRPVGNGLYGKPPTEVPPSAPAQPQKPKLDAVQAARMLRDEYGAEQGGRMFYGPVQKGADALQSAAQRTAMLKDLAAKSTLPDSARASIDTALAKLSPEDAQAYFAKANPIAQKYMRFARRDLFGDETGSISPYLLTRLGLAPLKYGAAGFLAKELGFSPLAGMGAQGAFDLARAYPHGSQAAARAALLAQLAGRAPSDTQNTASPR